MKLAPGIHADPGIRWGAARLVGYGITASVLGDRHAGGETPEELAKDYRIPLEAVMQALDYIESRRQAAKRGWATRRGKLAPAAPVR